MGKNVKSGAISRSDLMQVTEEFHRAQVKSQLRSGDIVVVRIGRSGEAAQIPVSLPKANCGGLVIVKGPVSVDPDFLVRYLNSPEGQKASIEESRGATRQTLNTKKVDETVIPLPPLPEQRRIVAKLDALQSRTRIAREALTAIPTLLDHYRQSVLAAAFRGELTSDLRASKGQGEIGIHEEGGLPDIPSSWSWRKLPDLGELGRGKSRHRPRNDPALYGGPYPFIQTGDVARSRGQISSHSQTYSELGLQQSRLWPARTVVITIAANIADSAILTYAACFPDSVVGFTANQSRCLPDYVEYFIRTAKRDLTAFAPATAQKNINLEILQEVRVPCAPLEEQAVIVERIQQAERFIAAVQSAVEGAHIDHLDQSLLATAFRGELVPQDPADEPASILLDRIRAARAQAGDAPRTRRPREAAAPTPARAAEPAAAYRANGRSGDPYATLLAALRTQGSLASSDAQAVTRLDAAGVRPLLQRMVAEGAAKVEGQKRGTRYVATRK